MARSELAFATAEGWDASQVLLSERLRGYVIMMGRAGGKSAVRLLRCHMVWSICFWVSLSLGL